MIASRVSGHSSAPHVVAACLTILAFTLCGCGDSSNTDNAATDSLPQTAAGEADVLARESREHSEWNAPDQSPVVSQLAFDPQMQAPPLTDSVDASTPIAAREPQAPPVKPTATPLAPTAESNIQVADPATAEAAAAEQLARELTELVIPPAWLTTVSSQWDMNKPWKDARLEIRRLLGEGDDASRREGIRLMWDYKTKGDMGNGHEYGMYLFLGNEPLWAIAAFRERLAEPEHQHPPYFDINGLASLYTRRGLFSEAEKLLLRGLDWAPPEAAWVEMRQAEMHDSLGDLYAAWDRLDDARTHYQESVRLYPLGKPPYGRHLLPRRARKVQAKLDLLSLQSLAAATLKDGRYQHTALGYSGDVNLTVNISSGRIADISIQHEEKIDQGATTIIPQRIIDSQSLAVDGVSGATVTKDAIVTGTLEALRKAGLK